MKRIWFKRRDQAGFVRLLALRLIENNSVTPVRIGEKKLAVFRQADQIVVSSLCCPHRYLQLTGGELNNDQITCPHHNWKFDVRSGAPDNGSDKKLLIYPANRHDGYLWVDLSAS